jgi:translocation and assembly module TamA
MVEALVHAPRAATTSIVFVAWSCGAAADVRISGVDGPLLDNVREFVDGEPDCEAAPAAVRRYAEELPQRIGPGLEAFGYYEAEVDPRVAASADGCWQITLAIDAGPRIVVRDATVTLAGDARNDEAMAAFRRTFSLEPGQPLHHGEYASFRSNLETLARQRGYLESAIVRERIDVYVNERAADILLELDSGPRYAFGEVTFGTAALADDVLGSFVDFAPGDPYDATKIAELQRELVASEYFRDAYVAPQIEAAANERIPIRVDLTAAQPKSYSVGAGFSTDDGARFRFEYDNVLRNRAGHQWDTEVLLAQTRQTAEFDYRIPAGNPQRDWLSVRAGLEREDVDAGIGSTARLGVHRVHVADSFTVTRFLDVLLERDELDDADLRTALLLPGMSWTHSYRDDFLRPREGYRLAYGVTLGIGSVPLVQSDFRGKWITATRWDARIIVRGRAGLMFDDDRFSEVPLSLRFFAGGDNSVRGFEYESLGARDDDGTLIGGNRVFEASIEYEHPLLEDWGIAVFADAGSAFLGSDVDLRSSAGIGARWFSPIGPVRVDIAVPIDVEPGEDDSPRLHISLGPDL